MSVIDFISVRRRANDTMSSSSATFAAASEPRKTAPPALSAGQFARHLSQIVEDEMRRALKRHVDVIDPREMIDLAKMMAEVKARYVGTALALAGNRTPMTDAEADQLRALRVRLQELESAYAEINEIVGQQLVEVRGVARES